MDRGGEKRADEHGEWSQETLGEPREAEPAVDLEGTVPVNVVQLAEIDRGMDATSNQRRDSDISDGNGGGGDTPMKSALSRTTSGSSTDSKKGKKVTFHPSLGDSDQELSEHAVEHEHSASYSKAREPPVFDEGEGDEAFDDEDTGGPHKGGTTYHDIKRAAILLAMRRSEEEDGEGDGEKADVGDESDDETIEDLNLSYIDAHEEDAMYPDEFVDEEQDNTMDSEEYFIEHLEDVDVPTELEGVDPYLLASMLEEIQDKQGREGSPTAKSFASVKEDVVMDFADTLTTEVLEAAAEELFGHFRDSATSETQLKKENVLLFGESRLESIPEAESPEEVPIQNETHGEKRKSSGFIEKESLVEHLKSIIDELGERAPSESSIGSGAFPVDDVIESTEESPEENNNTTGRHKVSLFEAMKEKAQMAFGAVGGDQAPLFQGTLFGSETEAESHTTPTDPMSTEQENVPQITPLSFRRTTPQNRTETDQADADSDNVTELKPLSFRRVAAKPDERTVSPAAASEDHPEKREDSSMSTRVETITHHVVDFIKGTFSGKQDDLSSPPLHTEGHRDLFLPSDRKRTTQDNLPSGPNKVAKLDDKEPERVFTSNIHISIPLTHTVSFFTQALPGKIVLGDVKDEADGKASKSDGLDEPDFTIKEKIQTRSKFQTLPKEIFRTEYPVKIESPQSTERSNVTPKVIPPVDAKTDDMKSDNMNRESADIREKKPDEKSSVQSRIEHHLLAVAQWFHADSNNLDVESSSDTPETKSSRNESSESGTKSALPPAESPHSVEADNCAPKTHQDDSSAQENPVVQKRLEHHLLAVANWFQTDRSELSFVDSDKAKKKTEEYVCEEKPLETKASPNTAAQTLETVVQAAAADVHATIRQKIQARKNKRDKVTSG